VRTHSNITALKDASGDLASAAHLKAVLGDALDLYSGDDALLLPFMSIGAVGIVSVASHWAAPELAAIVENVEHGDWAEARDLNERIAASCAFESSEAYPNPMPSKAALRALGVNAGQCRLPHPPSDATLDAAALKVVATLRASRG
jgi:4-hydroxy-tetrahydrodipicolinate synthase